MLVAGLVQLPAILVIVGLVVAVTALPVAAFLALAVALVAASVASFPPQPRPTGMTTAAAAASR